MLQTIRDKLTGWVALTIFGIIAFAFVFWGVAPLAIGATWAAKVNGIEIPAIEVRRAAQNQVAEYESRIQDDISPELLQQIRNGTLNQFINNTLMRARVISDGYRVSDAMLIEYIRSLSYFQVGGEFSLDSYAAMLAAQGLSKTGFEADQRSQMEILQLQQGLFGSSFVTSHEMRRFLELQGEEREITLVTIKASAFEDLVSPTDEEITGYYNANAQRYLTDETADVEYLEVRVADFTGQVEFDEQGLHDYYETVADNYKTEEQRRARHILIAVSDEDDNAAAEAKANAVLERARAGEDFSSLATEYSDDGGTAADGGDLGWSVRDDFVGLFADALFAMQENEISEPVRTRFGYHILRLDEIEPEDIRSFEDVRTEIESDYRAQLAEDAYYEAAQALGDQAFEAYDQLQSVAEFLDLELKSVSGFTRAGGGELGSDPRVVSAVFSTDVLSEGKNSQLLEVEDSRAISLRVSEYHPAEPRPLEEVREQIVTFMVTDQTRILARSAGAGIKSAIAAGADPRQLAQDNGATFTPARKVTRDTVNVARIVLEAVFSAPRPTTANSSVGGVSLATGDYTIFAISSVTPGHPASLTPAEWKRTEEQLANELGNAELAAFVAQLHETGTVRINSRTFDDVLLPPNLP